VGEHGLPSRAEAVIAAAEALADALAPKHRPSKHVTVPDFVGRLASERYEVAVAAGVRTEVRRLVDPPDPVPGTIVAQSVPAGTEVRRGSVVILDIEHRADRGPTS
jgi:beta-lactam-binding protein with PASTA domain